MKTIVSVNNPFGCNRYGFAFEHIEENGKYLDYGCYDGWFIHNVKKNKRVEYIGIDKNKDIVKKNPYRLSLICIEDLPLPFEKGEFDGITVLDVIEHIYDQGSLLKELNRVLKKNGKLIVTVPKKHIFSFLDLGNLKFIFPKIHKIFYILKYSKEEYENRYLNNPNGLIGDVEKKKAWHQHFTENELKTLLEENGFRVQKLDGSALFQRIFILLDILKLGFVIPSKIRKWDSCKFEKMNLFCEAIKMENVKN